MSTTFSLARRLKAGETVYSGWCGLPYPLVAEIIAREGFPAVALDSQHGLWDTASITHAIAAVHQGGAAPLVRVPVGDYGAVSRALDFRADDQHGRRRARFCGCCKISTSRRTKLGAASCHHAGWHCGPEGISRRSQYADGH